MNFCPNCNFLLYVTEIDDKLYNECINCGYKNEKVNKIIITNYYSKKQQEERFNKNIIYDNTIERTTTMTCPNVSCKSHKDKTINEFIFYPDKDRYHKTYICINCLTKWKVV